MYLKSLFLFTFSFIVLSAFAQIKQVKSEVEKMIDESWSVTVKLANSNSILHNHYLHTGRFEAKFIFKNKKDNVEFLLYHSTDSSFLSRVSLFQGIVSCAGPRNPQFCYISNNYYLFLKSYCWNQYSEKSRLLIDHVTNYSQGNTTNWKEQERIKKEYWERENDFRLLQRNE